MAMNLTDIHDHMDVYGSDGEKIGTVSRVYRYPLGGKISGGDPMTEGVSPDTLAAEASGREVGSAAGGRTLNPQMGPTEYPTAVVEDVTVESSGVVEEDIAVIHLDETPAGQSGGETGYFEVNSGGILGIGTHHLYLPFSIVTDVDPGNRVTVNCTKDTCLDQYSTQPES